MKTIFGLARLVSLIALSFSGLTAQATTQAMFAADGSKATFLLMSLTPTDLDANNLYVAMTTPEEVMNGRRTKRFSFAVRDGSPGLSITCVMSSMISSNGTCTVIMHATPVSVIDKDTLDAEFFLNDPVDVARISPSFRADPAGLIFESADQKLRMVIEPGDAAWFRLSYR